MKLPPRIVLDTNVLVSGLLKRNSLPGIILDQILAGNLKVVLDSRLMDEYRQVLARPRLQIPAVEAQQILIFLAVQGEWMPPTRLNPEPIEIPDPDDLPFAEAAIAGNVQALVTGNPRHFAFAEIYGVPILTPAEFLILLSD